MNTIKTRMRRLLSLFMMMSLGFYAQAQDCATWTEGCSNGGYEWVVTLAPGATINFGALTPASAWTTTQTGTNPDVWTVFATDPDPADLLTFSIGSWLVTGPCDDINFNLVGTDCILDACPDCNSLPCNITGSIPSNIVCNNNGTPNVTTDDTFTFDISFNETSGGTSWTANDPLNSSGNYGTTVNMGPYPISGGVLNFTVTDATEVGCTAQVSVTPPAVCSVAATCAITITNSTVGACNNNSTPFDPTDDTFAVTVDASITDGGATNQFTVSDGTTTFGPFAYGIGGVVTMPPDGNVYTLTFADVDEAGCEATVNVSQAPCCEIDVTTTIFPASNANNGEIILCINSGEPPFNISISPSANASIYEVPGSCQYNYIIAGLPMDTYTVNVSDNQGCETSISNQIVSAPNCTGFMLSQITGGTTSCNGASDGTMEVSLYDEGTATSITVDVGNGIAPVTFTDLENIELDNLPAGSYNVALFDNNGCEVTFLYNPVVVSEPTVVELSATTTDVTTVGGTDGTIQVCAGGANGGYTITTNPVAGTVLANDGPCAGQEGFLVSDMPAGDYEIIATDANGCGDTLHIVINDPDCSPLTIENLQVTNIDCGGTNTGVIELEVGGFGALTYSISLDGGETFSTPQPENTFTLDDLAAGSYDIIVMYGNGCTVSYNNHVVITENTPITLDPYIQNVTSFGGDDGSAALCINGGTEPYTVSVTPNTGTLTQTGASSDCADGYDLEDLVAGVYEVTVTDDLGCIQVFEVEILEPSCADFNMQLIVTDSVSCYGANDGSITMTVDAVLGAQAYTYEIVGLQTFTTASTTYTFNGLDNGTYIVYAYAANGCFVPYPIEVEIFEPEPLSSVIAVIPPCAGESNGVICLVPQEGTPDYMYNVLDEDDNNLLVEDGPSLECGGDFHINNVSAGSYHIELIDANGCIAHAITSVSEVSIGIEANITPTCSAVDVGAIDINFGGGTAPYTFEWSTGAVTEDLADLPDGTYTVTITDARGCTGEMPFTVNLEELNLVFNIAATCVEQNAGAVITLVENGLADYDLVWTGTSSGSIMDNTNNVITISDLNVGNYNVTVTDGRGCTAESSTAVPEYDIVADMTVLNTCEGQNNGFVGATPIEGIPNYNFLWSDGSNGGVLTDLSPGTYTVTITDVNGCTAVGQETVEEYELSATFDVQDVCSGSNSGFITMNIENAEGFVDYNWSNGGSTNPLFNLTEGTYSVTATDALGCTVTGSTSINEFDSPSVVASEDVTIVSGTSTNLNANASGGSGGYTYQWIPANVTNPTGSNTEAAPTETTTYTILVTDANGCTATDTLLVIVVPDVRVVMPTAFSPNGDTNNEVYEPFIPGDVARIVTFQVFDRWGALLHNDPSGGAWDGTFRGKEQPVGTYVYVVEYLDLIDQKELIKGHFNLIR